MSLELFDLPDDDDPPVLGGGAAAGMATVPGLVITPDADAYLAYLEAAIAPFEIEARAFAARMADAPITTPDELAALGKQSLFAKEREAAIVAVFEPAITKPREYLDRLYALRRRVIEGFATGGAVAAKRYTARQQELAAIDRQARAEADRQTRERQRVADQQAEAARKRIALEAAQAAADGRPERVATLIAEARAVESVTVEPVPVAPSQADAAAVAGLGSREDWTGTIVDLRTVIEAIARPAVMREMADAIERGDLTAGGETFTTTMIASRMRALILELPAIPIDIVQANAAALTARARADRDSITWPGVLFERKTIPVRRGRR